MNNYLEILLNGQQFKRIYEKKFNQISKKYGLTKIEVEILLFLENNQNFDTARDIVELRFFAKSHVSKAIDSLIHNGYVKAQPDVHDRRCIHLKNAECAEQILIEAKEMRKSLLDTLFKDVSSEEKAVMANVAKKITNNIKEALEIDK